MQRPSVAVIGTGRSAQRVHRAAGSIGLATAVVAPGAPTAAVGAAIAAGCDTIHPAGGTLPARLELARHARWAGLGCVGPPVEVLTRVADVATVRGYAVGAGLAPRADVLLPADPKWWHGVAATVGYPLRCTDAAGRGRVVSGPTDLVGAVRAARAASPGDGGRVTLRAEDSLRRVDVPVLADGRTALALPGRAPDGVARAASVIARVAGYTGACTVVVVGDRDGAWHFAELVPHLRGDGATLDALRAEIAIHLGARLSRCGSRYCVRAAPAA